MDLGVVRGGGDRKELQPPGDELIKRKSDPDEIISLGFIEIPQGTNDEMETGPVYRSCSVSFPNGRSFPEVMLKPNEASLAKMASHEESGIRNRSTQSQETASSFSIMKIIRSTLLRFKCCQETKDASSEPGIELENLCENGMKFTNDHGTEKTRRTFAGRKNFILRML